MTHAPSDATIWEPTVWRRRFVAFMIDGGAVTTLADLVRNNIVEPSGARWLPVIPTLAWMAYRFIGESITQGGSLGKLVAGIRVARDEGGLPSRRQIVARSGFLTLLFGVDYVGLLSQLFGGYHAGAWGLAPAGAAIGYLAACAWPAVRSKQGRLPHDRWTGTRLVYADQQSRPNQRMAPEPAVVTHPTRWLIAGAFVAMLMGAAFATGPLQERLLGSGKAFASPTEQLSRSISEITGVRNEVSAMAGVRYAAGEGRQRYVEITAEIPWRAGDERTMRSVLRILEDSASVDPRRYDRLTLSVEAGYAGLIRTRRSLAETFRWNSQQSRWVSEKGD